MHSSKSFAVETRWARFSGFGDGDEGRKLVMDEFSRFLHQTGMNHGKR